MANGTSDMSTIVYRDGIMAADTRAFAGYNLPIGTKTKIRFAPTGALVGVSTSKPGMSEAFMNWICDDGPEPAEYDLQAMIVEQTGEIYYYRGSLMPAGPLEADFMAIGSGAEAALGAMHMGATAEQAVEIAAKTDVWTAPPVITLALSDFIKPVRKRKKA